MKSVLFNYCCIILSLTATVNASSKEQEEHYFLRKGSSRVHRNAQICTQDVKECPDGTYVSRRGFRCEFEACPEGNDNSSVGGVDVACSLDVMECSDGSFVSRDPNNECDFENCPKKGVEEDSNVNEDDEDVVICAQDMYECPDGTLVNRDNKKNCEFKACRSKDNNDNNTINDKNENDDSPPKKRKACTKELKQCRNGKMVGRDRNNNCKFKPCFSGGGVSGENNSFFGKYGGIFSNIQDSNDKGGKKFGKFW